MKTHYKYKGIQKGFETIPDFRLYNCKHCETTIAERNLESHLKNKHYEEWNKTTIKKIDKQIIDYRKYTI